MYNQIFLKNYQKTIEKREHFNEKLINYRRNENIKEYVDDIGYSLEIIKGIKYLGSSIEKDNKIYKPESKNDNNNNSNKKIKTFHIEKSRNIIIIMNFELSYKEEKIVKTIKMKFPDLIDGQYFLINGNKYCPVLQLVDAECYSTSNTVTLKTSLMPIVLRSENFTLKDVNNQLDIKTKSINLDLFKNKINIFQYYFAKFGVEKTFKYFKFNDDENFILNIDEICYENEYSDEEEFYSFQVSSNLFINVWKEWFEKDRKQNSIMIATLINAFKGRASLDKLYEIEYWKRKLGNHFTKNNSNLVEKSESILSSLERLLDKTTIRNLRIKDVDKKDIYTVMRWMLINYATLFNIDNMDLSNKRIRIDEYLLYPLISKFSTNVYRMINSKVVNMTKLKTIFSNIGSDFLVKSIAKSDLVRYSNQVNTFDLFTNLKGTISGPQSQSVTSTGTNARSKSIDTSYVGRLDLCATSSNDPGTSFTVTPFCKIYDNFFFTKEPSISTKSIDDIKVE